MSSKINITIPSVDEVLDRSDSRTTSGKGDAGNGSSMKPVDQEADIDTDYDDLALESVLEPDTDDEKAQNGMLEIE